MPTTPAPLTPPDREPALVSEALGIEIYGNLQMATARTLALLSRADNPPVLVALQSADAAAPIVEAVHVC